MSGRSKKAEELSTKEDKIIKSTLFLLQDNKLKFDTFSKLNKVRSTIEGLEFDDKTKLDLIQSINSVSSSIKKSYKKQIFTSKGLVLVLLKQKKLSKELTKKRKNI